jgi:hypothetical protein
MELQRPGDEGRSCPSTRGTRLRLIRDYARGFTRRCYEMTLLRKEIFVWTLYA